MEEANDQPTGDAYVYALTDEPAYLQTDDDEKPTIIAEPPPDLAKFKCWFCRKSHEQVHTLFGAEYPVRDPTTSPRDADLHLQRVRHQVRGVADPGEPEAPRTP